MTEQINLHRDDSSHSKKRFQTFMESVGLLKSLTFVCFISLIIVFVSINLYLNSDRSKYDLYRPGQSKLETNKTQVESANIESSQDLPVYKDEISQIKQEIKATITEQTNKPSFSESDLSDQNLIPPEVNVLGQ